MLCKPHTFFFCFGFFSFCQVFTLFWTLKDPRVHYPAIHQLCRMLFNPGQVKDWWLVIMLVHWGDKLRYSSSMFLPHPVPWQATRDGSAGFPVGVGAVLRQVLYPAGEFRKWFCCAALAAGICSGSTVMKSPKGQKKGRCLLVQQLLPAD